MSAVKTVLGRIPPEKLKICDAHNHLWIKTVGAVAEDAPHLDNFAAISQELIDYKNAGGDGIADCQPGGCGRDASTLRELSKASNVHIITCTGFHLLQYYPPDYWLFSATVEQARDYFVSELNQGTEETRSTDEPVYAGFVKAACESSLNKTPTGLLEAAIAAASQTGTALLVHTQRGQAVEDLLQFCTDRDLPATRLIICHIDKRPDFGLHSELAKAGVLLEYDTFYRPQYAPEDNLWPLMEKMIDAGLSHNIALALDMAEAKLWTRLGNGPGLTKLPIEIKQRLEQLGVDETAIAALLGGNIATRLAS